MEERKVLNLNMASLSRQAETVQPVEEKSPRVEALDLFRGVGALAAVGIHVLQAILKDYPHNSLVWLIAGVVNRLLLFAVPSFLLLTAILLTRKLLKDYDLKTYYRKRIQGALFPYLLWSVLYTGIAYKLDPKFTAHDAMVRILTGKSFYHLYFLGVILQLYLVLPLLVPLFRRPKPLALLLPLLIGLELGFYWLNRRYLNLPYLGSVLPWYIVTLGLGMWLGSKSAELPQIVTRWLPITGTATVVFGVLYMPYALGFIADKNVDTFAYQVYEWGYTNSAGLFLLGLLVRCRLPEKGRLALLSVGTISMQMYLLHRFPVWIMDRFAWTGSPVRLVGLLVFTTLLSLLIPVLVARWTKNSRISVLLFGR